MPDLLASVSDLIREKQLLSPAEPLLVAVSGGIDSMVLADLLRQCCVAHHSVLVLAHFNHGLRGAMSDQDERFVQEAAAAWGLECLVGRGDVASLAKKEKRSIEDAARVARHQFLSQAALSRGGRTVALGHHAGDQTETCLLNLFRGAGSDGLAGMDYRSPSPADPRVALIRPLLGTPRSAIEAYAQARNLAFRLDESNLSSEPLRNRIRNELLPLLEARFQPAIHGVIQRSMDLAREESRCLQQWAEEWLQGDRRPGFNHLPVAIQRRVIRQQVAQLDFAPGFALVEFLRSRPGLRVVVQPGQRLWRRDDGVVLRESFSALAFNAETAWVDLTAPLGTVLVGHGTLSWTRLELEGRPWDHLRAEHPGAELFDPDLIGDCIQLRYWQPGDRFQPRGLPSAVKLQDLFTNAKVPAAERRKRLVALTSAGVVFWVEGLRIGEPCCCRAFTRRILVWHWSSNPPQPSA